MCVAINGHALLATLFHLMHACTPVYSIVLANILIIIVNDI